MIAAGTGREQAGGTLLLADADNVTRAQLARDLSERGYHVRPAGSLREARAIIADEAVACAVIDYRLGEESGTALIPDLVERSPRARIVILSRYASLRGAVAALRAGAIDFLARPAAAGEIDSILRGLPVPCRASLTPARSLAEIGGRHAEATLRLMGGRLAPAARALNLDPRTLRRLLADAEAAR